MCNGTVPVLLEARRASGSVPRRAAIGMSKWDQTGGVVTGGSWEIVRPVRRVPMPDVRLDPDQILPCEALDLQVGPDLRTPVLIGPVPVWDGTGRAEDRGRFSTWEEGVLGDWVADDHDSCAEWNSRPRFKSRIRSLVLSSRQDC